MKFINKLRVFLLYIKIFKFMSPELKDVAIEIPLHERTPIGDRILGG